MGIKGFSLKLAKEQAQRFSLRYYTYWYVREVEPGVFQSYAHDSDDEATVACFYAGKEVTG